MDIIANATIRGVGTTIGSSLTLGTSTVLKNYGITSGGTMVSAAVTKGVEAGLSEVATVAAFSVVEAGALVTIAPLAILGGGVVAIMTLL